MKVSSHFLRRSVTYKPQRKIHTYKCCVHRNRHTAWRDCHNRNLSFLFVRSLSACPHTLNKTSAGRLCVSGGVGFMRAGSQACQLQSRSALCFLAKLPTNPIPWSPPPLLTTPSPCNPFLITRQDWNGILRSTIVSFCMTVPSQLERGAVSSPRQRKEERMCENEWAECWMWETGALRLFLPEEDSLVAIFLWADTHSQRLRPHCVNSIKVWLSWDESGHNKSALGL